MTEKSVAETLEAKFTVWNDENAAPPVLDGAQRLALIGLLRAIVWAESPRFMRCQLCRGLWRSGERETHRDDCAFAAFARSLAPTEETAK